jgi:hypothetical protein
MASNHRRRIEKLEAATTRANEPPPMIIIRVVERIDGDLVVGEQFRMDANGRPVLLIATGVPRHPSKRNFGTTFEALRCPSNPFVGVSGNASAFDCSEYK